MTVSTANQARAEALEELHRAIVALDKAAALLRSADPFRARRIENASIQADVVRRGVMDSIREDVTNV